MHKIEYYLNCTDTDCHKCDQLQKINHPAPTSESFCKHFNLPVGHNPYNNEPMRLPQCQAKATKIHQSATRGCLFGNAVVTSGVNPELKGFHPSLKAASKFEPGDNIAAIQLTDGEAHTLTEAEIYARPLVNATLEAIKTRLATHKVVIEHGLTNVTGMNLVCTPSQPVWTTEGLKDAGDLKKGDELFNYVHYSQCAPVVGPTRVTSVRVEKLIVPVKVYEFSIAGHYHLFIANGIMVHNIKA